MSRSSNSFTAWVGGRAPEIDEDRVTLPEKDLWVAVLSRAVVDACKGPPRLNMGLLSNITRKHYYTHDRNQARHFFMKGGPHFNLICEMAGRNPDYVKAKIRKIILRNEGWNVDVPIVSNYRRGRGKKRGRPRKKKLTGNSYYSAMGKKGGRPRLYAV
jgi:hypothetical protein